MASLSTGPAGSGGPGRTARRLGLRLRLELVGSAGRRLHDQCRFTDGGAELIPVTTTQASTYTYNGDGLRMSADTPAGLVTFAWDTTGSNPEVLSDDTYSYVYGPDGEVVEQVTQSGTATFLVQDQIGSTRLLVNSSGSVVGALYDAMARWQKLRKCYDIDRLR